MATIAEPTTNRWHYLPTLSRNPCSKHLMWRLNLITSRRRLLPVSFFFATKWKYLHTENRISSRFWLLALRKVSLIRSNLHSRRNRTSNENDSDFFCRKPSEILEVLFRSAPLSRTKPKFQRAPPASILWQEIYTHFNYVSPPPSTLLVHSIKSAAKMKFSLLALACVALSADAFSANTAGQKAKVEINEKLVNVWV